jgi:hypothetical protein
LLRASNVKPPMKPDPPVTRILLPFIFSPSTKPYDNPHFSAEKASSSHITFPFPSHLRIS